MNEAAAIELAREAVELRRCEPARKAPRRRFRSRGAFTSKRASAPSRDSKARPVRVSSCASFATVARRRLSTTDFTPEGLREAVARTVAHADVVAPDECAGLPDEVAGDDAHLDLVDPAVAERARRAEDRGGARARTADSRGRFARRQLERIALYRFGRRYRDRQLERLCRGLRMDARRHDRPGRWRSTAASSASRTTARRRATCATSKASRRSQRSPCVAPSISSARESRRRCACR